MRTSSCLFCVFFSLLLVIISVFSVLIIADLWPLFSHIHFFQFQYSVFPFHANTIFKNFNKHAMIFASPLLFTVIIYVYECVVRVLCVSSSLPFSHNVLNNSLFCFCAHLHRSQASRNCLYMRNVYLNIIIYVNFPLFPSTCISNSFFAAVFFCSKLWL